MAKLYNQTSDRQGSQLPSDRREGAPPISDWGGRRSTTPKASDKPAPERVPDELTHPSPPAVYDKTGLWIVAALIVAALLVLVAH